jgi:PAS domain S-box-containing protein
MAKPCEEFRFSEETAYQFIMDMAKEGVVVLNHGNAIVFVNKKLLALMGYSQEEMLCHSLYHFVAEEDWDDVKKSLERWRKGTKETFVARVKRKDSRDVWAAVASTPLMDEHGKYEGVVLTVLDITPLKQSEKALEREKYMAEMYLDLMAHDINNLNQVAIGYTEIVVDGLRQQEPNKAQIPGMLNKSLEALNQCTGLINNVKTLRRLKTESIPSEVVDLGEVIAEAVKDYPKVINHDVDIKYEKILNCYVRANPLLKVVFTNLISNSVKHSHGPLTVWITVDSTMEKGRKFYKTSVTDNGPGIPEDLKGQLFQRFKTGDRKATGHGLGLYLVKMIVEGFEGSVKVKDRVPRDHSKGARFVVLLPAVDDTHPTGSDKE